HPEPWIAANDSLLVERFEVGLKHPTPPRTYQFQLQATAAAGDANLALNAYRWPVLIQHGSIDRLVPPENARTLKATVPRARLEMMEGDSHNFWQHDAARSAEVVLDFLDNAEREWKVN
ncbi:MAG: alpha/beta hydrolase, partial [Anaerolineaceae bacterium]